MGFGPSFFGRLLPLGMEDVPYAEATVMVAYYNAAGDMVTPTDEGPVGVIEHDDIVYSDGSSFEGSWPQLARAG